MVVDQHLVYYNVPNKKVLRKISLRKFGASALVPLERIQIYRGYGREILMINYLDTSAIIADLDYESVLNVFKCNKWQKVVASEWVPYKNTGMDFKHTMTKSIVTLADGP